MDLPVRSRPGRALRALAGAVAAVVVCRAPCRWPAAAQFGNALTAPHRRNAAAHRPAGDVLRRPGRIRPGQRPGHRHAAMSRPGRTATSCEPIRSPSTEHRRCGGNRPCRAVGTRRRSAVRRLCRNAEQHERRHPEGHARAAAAERPAGGQRRATDRRRRSTSCRRSSTRPATYAPRTPRGRRCGRFGPHRRCRTWSTSGSNTATPTLEMYGSPGRLFALFLAR